MTNVLVERVKKVADTYGRSNEDVWRITDALIALLEADCARLHNRIGEILDERQGNEQMWIVRDLRREITYKQQAIEELKNLK